MISEGIAASKNSIFVDTANTRVDIATASYGGGLSSVGLFISSNAVFSTSNSNNCVIYATGSISCLSYIGTPALASTQTWTGANTFLSSVTFTTARTNYTNALATATLIYVPAVFGDWQLIAASNPVSASQFAWAGLVSTDTFINGVRYRMCWDWQETSGSGIPQLYINGDMGTNYGYACFGLLGGTGARSASSAVNGAGSLPIQCQDNFTNPSNYNGCWEFRTSVVGIMIDGWSGGDGQSATQADSFWMHARYSNDDSITRITIVPAGGGNMLYAHFTLERLVYP